MKTNSFLLLASAAASAHAQVKYEDGKYVCAKANVAYCAGDSLGTDIIIRCDENKVGQPGRCTDNLAGEPPLGVQPALCYQTSETAGDAACEKNCIVYPSGEPFTLPAELCTPQWPVSTSTTDASLSTTALTNPATSATSSIVGSGSITITVTTTTSSSAEPSTTSGGGDDDGGDDDECSTETDEPTVTHTFTNPGTETGEPTVTHTLTNPSIPPSSMPSTITTVFTNPPTSTGGGGGAEPPASTSSIATGGAPGANAGVAGGVLAAVGGLVAVLL